MTESYRDPDLSEKWLKEAKWRSLNDLYTHKNFHEHTLIIFRLIEEVHRKNEIIEDMSRTRTEDSKKFTEEELEHGYQQLAEDEEWISIQRAKQEARAFVSVGTDKLKRIGDELIPRFFDTKKEAVKTLQRIKAIVEE